MPLETSWVKYLLYSDTAVEMGMLLRSGSLNPKRVLEEVWEGELRGLPCCQEHGDVFDGGRFACWHPAVGGESVREFVVFVTSYPVFFR